jgi:hypothetical protein
MPPDLIMNVEITAYGFSFLLCVAAFGATLLGLLLTVVVRRLHSRRREFGNRGEKRPLAA